MKPLIEKVLASGLVDKATASLMELWGYLPEGSVEKVKEDELKNATKEKLERLAHDLAEEVEKEHHIRETYLDLERIRWPVTAYAIRGVDGCVIAYNLPAVMDRMGRYYFRSQDVKEEWFVPGYTMDRHETSKEDGNKVESFVEKILQAQVLYIGEQGVCIQVTTDRS